MKIINEENNFLETFKDKIDTIEINESEIIHNLKKEAIQMKTIQTKRRLASKNNISRKIFLFLSDSLRKYNGVACDLVSSRVTGRKPLEKEDCINYEVDSDEELEEQVILLNFNFI